MDKFKSIKNEAKRLLKANILQKSGIVDFSQLEQRQIEHLAGRYIDKILIKLLRQNRISIEKEKLDILKKDIIAELAGFGIIDRLLKDPAVSDILINGPNQIYIERTGMMEKVNVKFGNKEEISSIIEKMMMKSGKRLDASSPFIDFRAEGGARVTAVIPPISPSVPFLCIRKMLKDVLSTEDLKKFGTLDQKLLDFLKYCVRARLNILVSGSTGVGKTTLINLMLREFIPRDERLVIIEDTQELVVEESRHVVRLLTRSPSIERKGEVTLRDLVRLSLHLRPDRIIVGEVRGEEAFHFLHVINTGHEGSMCTIHATDSEDTLNRLEMLSLMGQANIDYKVIRRFLDSGIDLIVNMERLPSGQRIISQVSEFNYQEDRCIINDIFSLQRKVRADKEIYEIKLSGHVPSFWDKLKIRTDIPDDFFDIGE